MSGVEDAKAVVGVAAEIVKIAKEDPDAKEAGRNLASSLVIVTQTVKNILLPLAAVNYAIAKAETYFKTRFEPELAAKTAGIPPEDVIEPKASIAGPALQALAFSVDEDVLREMYLTLIATSMDGRQPEAAHPAFVEIIKQLSAGEVKLLSELLVLNRNIPIAEYRHIDQNDGSWRTLARHQMELSDEDTGAPAAEPELTAFMDNWIRLGLISVDYRQVVSPETDQYSWVPTMPGYLEIADKVPDGYRAGWQPGIASVTAFGKRFAHAIGLHA